MMFLLTALALLQTPAAPPAPDILNFLRVTPEFCTGGQPSPEHVARLKADGVKAVLNLRQPGEHQADEERQAVQAAGLRYFNIPVDAAQPTDAQADEFLTITDDPANRPMFIHCRTAARVGAFWLIRRVVRDGLSFDEALEEARRVGLRDGTPLVEFARRYVDSHARRGRG
jgi:uncharacterized protein (TIGR01244 family)